MVLDLFAGTGALGLEALSRGASRAVFIDSGRAALDLIGRNIALARLGDRAQVIRRDATDLGPAPAGPASLVFLDPPYGRGLGELALRHARAGGWIAPRRHDRLGRAGAAAAAARPAPHRPTPLRRHDHNALRGSMTDPTPAADDAARRLPKLVIFDCDGVLVDSETILIPLLTENLARHGLRMTEEEIEHDLVGGTLQKTAVIARERGADLPPDWADSLYETLYGELAKGTPLVEGVRDVIERLEAAGIPYAVGSNGEERKMDITLQQHDWLWERVKDRLFSGRRYNAIKPDPKLYLIVAESFATDPADCVVIDDSVSGCTAGVRAGMRTLGYDPRHGGARLRSVGAEPFSRMDQVPGLLGL